METDIQDFKNSYNRLLQTFRELKEQEPEDEPKLKALNEQLTAIEKNNFDASVRIKILEAQLGGITENLEDIFVPELRVKDQILSELEEKLEKKQAELERKTVQHESIVNNLRAKLEEQQRVQEQLSNQYNSLIEEASRGSSEEERRRLDQILGDKENQSRALEEIVARIRQLESSNQISTNNFDFPTQIQKTKTQIEQTQAQVTEMQTHLAGRERRREQALESFKQDYLPKIERANHERDDFEEQGKNSIREAEQRFNQQNLKVDELKGKIRVLNEEIKPLEELEAKCKAEGQRLEELTKERHDSKKEQKESLLQLEEEKLKLEENVTKLQVALDSSLKTNKQILEQLAVTNQQLEEHKNRQASKTNPKDIEKLKVQKADLDKQVEREKERQESLKESQKTYRPQSELKQLKQKYQQLQDQLDDSSVVSKENKKCKNQMSDLNQKITIIKKREEEMVDKLRVQFKQVSAVMKELEAENKAITKEINDSNFKLNAYTKAYPDHQERRLEEKKLHKKIEEEKAREKRHKHTEEEIHKRAPELNEEQTLDSILGIAGTTAQAKAPLAAKGTGVYVAGGILLLILLILFTRG